MRNKYFVGNVFLILSPAWVICGRMPSIGKSPPEEDRYGIIANGDELIPLNVAIVGQGLPPANQQLFLPANNQAQAPQEPIQPLQIPPHLQVAGPANHPMMQQYLANQQGQPDAQIAQNQEAGGNPEQEENAGGKGTKSKGSEKADEPLPGTSGMSETSNTKPKQTQGSVRHKCTKWECGIETSSNDGSEEEKLAEKKSQERWRRKRQCKHLIQLDHVLKRHLLLLKRG